MSDRDSQDWLVERISKGRTDLVIDLIGAGDIDLRELGAWCAYYGDVSALRILLSNGLSFESLGRNLGLGAAAFHGHWKLCEFLLDRGADANEPDPVTGETPLHAALSTGRRPGCALSARVLIAAGGDPNRATAPGAETDAFMRGTRTRGETALHRAGAFADQDTILLLINAGANREAHDMNGDTPLSWASWHGRPDAVLRLLCYGPYQIHDDRKSMEQYLLGEPAEP